MKNSNYKNSYLLSLGIIYNLFGFPVILGINIPSFSFNLSDSSGSGPFAYLHVINPVNISYSIDELPKADSSISLPPLVDPLNGLQIPDVSPLNGLPLGNCKPIFKCPKTNSSQLGSCIISFRCN